MAQVYINIVLQEFIHENTVHFLYVCDHDRGPDIRFICR